jgi:tRNA dimethylallyltransferase
LYVKAITDGFDEMPEIPEGLRDSINREFEVNGLGWLQKKVAEVDPDYFAIVDQKNPHRLIRALEINHASGKTVGEWRKKEKKHHPFQIVKIGLELEREDIYARIDERMDHMVDAGLFTEAEQFFEKRSLNSLQTVGYQEIFGFLEGQYDKTETIRLLKRNSRRYAKRQMTWFKRDSEITWFKPEQVEELYNFIVNVQSFHE